MLISNEKHDICHPLFIDSGGLYTFSSAHSRIHLLWVGFAHAPCRNLTQRINIRGINAELTEGDVQDAAALRMNLDPNFPLDAADILQMKAKHVSDTLLKAVQAPDAKATPGIPMEKVWY